MNGIQNLAAGVRNFSNKLINICKHIVALENLLTYTDSFNPAVICTKKTESLENASNDLITCGTGSALLRISKRAHYVVLR